MIIIAIEKYKFLKISLLIISKNIIELVILLYYSRNAHIKISKSLLKNIVF